MFVRSWPVSRHAVITMANRNRVNVDGYASKIFDILEAGATPDADENDTGEDSINLDEYTGSYDLRPWSGERLIFRWKDGLTMLGLPTMDPLKNLVRLKHIEGDRFHTIRSDKQAGHEVTFRRNPEGEITHVISHSIDLPKL